MSAAISKQLSMSSSDAKNRSESFCAHAAFVLGLALALSQQLSSQALPAPPGGQSSGPTASSFQGGVPQGEVSSQRLELSLDDAILRGLRNNLGVILSGTQTAGARGQRLSQLQNLLPDVELNTKQAVQQVDLAALGLRAAGFPRIIGPFGYIDIRGNLTWSLLDLTSLRNYFAARHHFVSTQLSEQDARDLVVLTVGNAYLLVLADQALVTSTEAQVATAKVSLDQAVANHEAGTAPRLDELRARVAYQGLQQQLITARNGVEKDKLALARAIGLPLEQQFDLSDTAPYSEFDRPEITAAIRDAQANRKDLAAIVEQTYAYEQQRKAATADRYPKITIQGDYGLIGVNLGSSNGTGDAQATLSVPIFKEYGLRGEAQVAQAQLDTQRAQLSDMKAQVDADVRDALLDIASTQQQVEVSRSNVELANEALKDAQERYANGVSDNLAVTTEQQSVANANDQYVTSLYRNNVAKLNLARALGASQNYKSYLGGK
jgi:outer membrane protein TolC